MAEIQARDYTQGARKSALDAQAMEPLMKFFSQLRENQQQKDLLAQKGSQESEAAKLKALLQGQAQEQSIGRVKEMMESAPEGSGASVTPEGAGYTKGFNPLATLAQDRFFDKQAEGIADKGQKEGIPQMQAQGDLLKQDMTRSGGLQSVGGMKNAVPDSLVPLAEYFKILPKGSTLERQHIAGLRNAAMHAQFGSRQTEAEKSMMADQLGLHMGTSADNVQQGIEGLGNVANRESQNVMSGVNPIAKQRFLQRGGNNQVQNLSGGAPQASPQQGSPQAPNEAQEFQNFYNNVWKKMPNGGQQQPPGQ